MTQSSTKGKRSTVLISLAMVALLLSFLALVLSSTNTTHVPDKVTVSIGAPDLFGCGSQDPETLEYVAECVNASVASVSGNSFAVVLSASFANSTTGAIVGGFKSQDCLATRTSSPCLILISLETAGNYNMTILAIGADGKTIPSSPTTWTMFYGQSLVSEGSGKE